MFNDAWRIQRDFFFDEKLRGVDWEAMRRKYEVFLPDVASRRDLNYLIEDLFAELGQSHVEITGRRSAELPAVQDRFARDRSRIRIERTAALSDRQDLSRAELGSGHDQPLDAARPEYQERRLSAGHRRDAFGRSA